MSNVLVSFGVFALCVLLLEVKVSSSTSWILYTNGSCSYPQSVNRSSEDIGWDSDSPVNCSSQCVVNGTEKHNISSCLHPLNASCSMAGNGSYANCTCSSKNGTVLYRNSPCLYSLTPTPSLASHGTISVGTESPNSEDSVPATTSDIENIATTTSGDGETPRTLTASRTEKIGISATTSVSGEGTAVSATSSGASNGGQTTSASSGSSGEGQTSSTTTSDGSGGQTFATTGSTIGGGGGGDKGSTATATTAGVQPTATASTSAGNSATDGGGEVQPTATTSTSAGNSATDGGQVQPTATTSTSAGSTQTVGGESSTSSSETVPTTEAKLDDAEVTMEMTLAGEFKEELKDKTSAAFKEKAKECEDLYCPVIKSSLSDPDALVSCNVTGFSNGSIVANVLIILNQELANISSDDSYENIFKTAIIQANSTGAFGNLTLYAMTITAVVPTRAPKEITSAPQDDTDDDGLEGWEIALIVIFVIILIGVVIFVVFLIMYKKKTEPAKELEDRCSNEQMGATNPNIYDNAEDRV